MLDRRFVREDPQAVKAAVRVKGIDLDVDELLRGWAEFARARKVAGERAYALTGDMVLLERAMVRVPKMLRPYLGGRTEL
jgi:seryl-tRNA synthetase